MKHLLIVDDHSADLKRVYELAGEESGVKVTVIENGLDALNFLSKEPVDGVLLDLAMFPMDGISVAEAIRAMERIAPHHDPVKIAFYTGQDVDEVIERSIKEVGARRAAFIKPYDPVELMRDVRTWLDEETMEKVIPQTIIKQNQGGVYLTVLVAFIGIVALILTVTYYQREAKQDKDRFELLLNQKQESFELLIHQKEEQNAYQYAEQRGNYNQIKAVCEYNWEQVTRKWSEKGEKADVVLKPCIVNTKESQ